MMEWTHIPKTNPNFRGLIAQPAAVLDDKSGLFAGAQHLQFIFNQAQTRKSRLSALI